MKIYINFINKDYKNKTKSVLMKKNKNGYYEATIPIKTEKVLYIDGNIQTKKVKNAFDSRNL